MPFLPFDDEIPDTTRSDESLLWAIEQISHCRDTHHNCTSYSSSATLPKRVVFVGTAAKPTLRLYESQGERDPYICLSYCWGQRDFLRTQVDNFESHKTCIEPDHLPPTLNDAIEYTRRLGVRYIWIDSLCIIQDSLLDWREEAGKMASIFQNSFLVLSATRSTDVHGGLYTSIPSDCATFALTVNTDTNKVFACHVADLDMTSNATETIHVRRAFSHPRSGASDTNTDLSLLPTLRRGWIFQERFLSTRVLHFGPQELYFECLESSTCQCMLNGPIIYHVEMWYGETHGDETQSNAVVHREAPKMYYSPSSWRRLDRDGLVYVWHRLVYDYTKLKLTYEKDIFPAISGLAREMGIVRAALHADADKTHETRYYAGLWRDSLVRDLCWKVKITHTSDGKDDESHRTWMDRPRNWRAPTWSWGSVNGPVKFLGQRYGVKDFFEPLCEVVDVSCTAAGSNEMGELIAGRMVMRGQLLPARVTQARSEAHRKDGLRRPQDILSLDFGLVVEKFVQEVWVDDGCQDLLRLLDEVEAGGDRPIVFCFLLGITKITEMPVFLLLKKIKELPEDQVGQDVYQRFGRLQLQEYPRLPIKEWRKRFGIFAQAKEEVVTII